MILSVSMACAGDCRSGERWTRKMRAKLNPFRKGAAPRSQHHMEVQNNSEQQILDINRKIMVRTKEMAKQVDKVCFVDMFYQQVAPAGSCTIARRIKAHLCAN
jgi:hypothetical protein